MKRLIILTVLILSIVVIAFILRKNYAAIKSAETISQQELEIIPVKIETVKLRSISNEFTFAGILNPKRSLMVISQTQGQVLKVNAKVGNYVKSGSEVVKVDDELMQAELMVTEANFNKARLDMERFESMAESDGVTRDQVEKIKLNYKNAEARFITSKKRVKDTSIKAPFSGYINQLFTEDGSLLGPGKPVFELVDISGFKIKLKAGESEVMHINDKMLIEVVPKSRNDLRLEGKLVSVAVSTNFAQQYAIEIEVDNKDRALKGGLLAEVYFSEPKKEPVIAVAKKHLVYEDGKPYLFTVTDNKARKIEVTTGVENDNWIEIKTGLLEGDMIVSVGIAKLGEISQVKIIND